VIIINCFVLLLGLIVGSFLNVLIYRIPRGIGFVKGRSFCPKCKKKINWYDNMPVISFVLLGGRCRRCHSPISWRYPLVELTTGLVTLLIFNFRFFSPRFAGEAGILNQYQIFNFQTIIDLILSLTFVWGLTVIFFVDLEHQIIPDEIVFPVIFLFLFFLLITNHQSLITNHLPSALLSFLFLFTIFLLSKGKGMGLGDVKLAFLMGLVLGYPKIVVAMYFAFLTGAVMGIILILGKKAKFGQRIAFGPFLSGATVIAYLWGEKILSFIQKLLF